MKFDASKWTVETMLGMIGSQQLRLQPDFQRFYIWNQKKEQGFIDSILREYPIPPVWIWRHVDDDGVIVHDVIDGQQRLTCIKKFVDNKFPVRHMDRSPTPDVLKKEDGSWFSKAPPGKKQQKLSNSYRMNFMGYKIPYVEVDTNDRTKIIDIFKRLNEASTNLNPQEMRNAFYVGEFKNSVYDLTAIYQDHTYWGANGKVFAKPDKDRMANQQFVSDLYVALIEGEVQHQSQKLDHYYHSYDASFPDKNKIENRVKTALTLIRSLVPAQCRFVKNTSDFYSLFLYMDELLQSNDVNMNEQNKDVIKHTLRTFLDEYAAYIDRRRPGRPETSIFERYRETIVGRQREKEVRETRAEIIKNLIDPGIKRTDKDPIRIFSEEQRDFLWSAAEGERICAICGDEIESYDEYQPDHIDPHAQGGRTVIENGQLSHASCNQSKSDKLEPRKKVKKRKGKKKTKKRKVRKKPARKKKAKKRK